MVEDLSLLCACEERVLEETQGDLQKKSQGHTRRDGENGGFIDLVDWVEGFGESFEAAREHAQWLCDQVVSERRAQLESPAKGGDVAAVAICPLEMPQAVSEDEG